MHEVIHQFLHRNLETQTPLLVLQNLLIDSKHPHNSLSSFCCSMLLPIDAPKQLDTSLNKPTPLSQIQNQHTTLLRLRLRLHSLFAGDLLPKFNRMVERGLLITEVQQIEDIFSIVGKNVSVWLSILGLEATDVCAEMRKTQQVN